MGRTSRLPTGREGTRTERPSKVRLDGGSASSPSACCPARRRDPAGSQRTELTPAEKGGGRVRDEQGLTLCESTERYGSAGAVWWA